MEVVGTNVFVSESRPGSNAFCRVGTERDLVSPIMNRTLFYESLGNERREPRPKVPRVNHVLNLLTRSPVVTPEQ